MPRNKFNKQDGCDGKIAFNSLSEASEAAYTFGRKHTKVQMCAYKCAFCNKYHTGHSNGNRELRSPFMNKPRRNKLNPRDYDTGNRKIVVRITAIKNVR